MEIRLSRTADTLLYLLIGKQLIQSGLLTRAQCCHIYCLTYINMKLPRQLQDMSVTEIFRWPFSGQLHLSWQHWWALVCATGCCKWLVRKVGSAVEHTMKRLYDIMANLPNGFQTGMSRYWHREKYRISFEVDQVHITVKCLLLLVGRLHIWSFLLFCII